MEDLVVEPGLMRELMDFILPNQIAFAKAQVEAGADLIFVGESAASLVGEGHMSAPSCPSSAP